MYAKTAEPIEMLSGPIWAKETKY